MVAGVWEKTNCLSRHWQLFRAVFSVDKSNTAYSVAIKTHSCQAMCELWLVHFESRELA